VLGKAPGPIRYGNLKEILAKSIGNRSGELLVYLHMESLRRISFKINRKLVWRAPDHFIHGILKETGSNLSQSWSGKHMVNLQMESSRISFQN